MERFAVVTELPPNSAGVYHIIVSGTALVIATIDPDCKLTDRYDVAYQVCQALNNAPPGSIV